MLLAANFNEPVHELHSFCVKPSNGFTLADFISSVCCFFGDEKRITLFSTACTATQHACALGLPKRSASGDHSL